MPKITEGQERVYLEQLGERLHKTPDQVLDMALNGKLSLWCEFTDVLVTKQKKKKKQTPPELYNTVELRIAPEVLAQMTGKAERLLVTAECACLTAKGKPALVSNAVGEEWGETSMIGLQPTRLYAYMDAEFEETDNAPAEAAMPEKTESEDASGAPQNLFSMPADHPCYAPELHIALACWQTLFAEEKPEAVNKTTILQWLRRYYPALSKTAGERIALVVSPAKSQR